jgi:predicted RNA-binding Zn-ribbon protein involved in translation (DUF1610 family)
MNITTQEIVLTIIGAIIIISVALTLQNRGTKLRCPECSEVFNTPMMDQKISGLGWTLPYIGQVACPKCGAKRSRKSYEKIKIES